jgi:peptidoglycan/xylan/chitin deacetylase (PgdA/CDA1 family)
MTSLTTDQIVSETIWNVLAVYSVIGKVPKYIRAPCKFCEMPLYFTFNLS